MLEAVTTWQDHIRHRDIGLATMMMTTTTKAARFTLLLWIVLFGCLAFRPGEGRPVAGAVGDGDAGSRGQRGANHGNPSAGDTRKTRSVCQTQYCVSVANELLQNMDLSADPCKDFYQYSCGGWLNHTTIPPGHSHWNRFSEVEFKTNKRLKDLLKSSDIKYRNVNSTAVRKAKDFYASCMDKPTLISLGDKPMKDLIDDVSGYWPILNSTWNESKWDFFKTLVNLHRLDVVPLFNMGVSTDDRNNSNSIITFEQSGLSLDSKQLYKANSSYAKKIRDAFVTYGVDVVKALGGSDEAKIKSDMEDILQFEINISTIFVSKTDLQDPGSNHHYKTVSQLHNNMSSLLDISKYLEFIFGHKIPSDTEIDVVTPDYMQRMSELVHLIDKRIVCNYMVWSLVQSMVRYLPEPFEGIVDTWDTAQSGVASELPRWLLCVERTDAVMGFATSAIFIDKTFDAESRQKVSRMVESIRKEFIQNLDAVGWMDPITKQKAIEKAQLVTLGVGYPDWMGDADKLDAYYSNYTMNKTTFFANRLRTRDLAVKRNMGRLNNARKKEEWSMNPTETNAYNSLTHNYIVMAAGILQPPFYDKRFPDALSYGSFLYIIGHEFTHGYDSNGRYYDKHGNMIDWWKNDTVGSFVEKTMCMAQQYSKYKKGNLTLDGNLTLSENIADNGGIKLAYKAFAKVKKDEESVELPGLNMTEDQLFFLAMAQKWCYYATPEADELDFITATHSPGKFRVQGSVSNTPEFGTAFECPDNSAMNPTSRCSVW